jgi:tetratricopeptide (TPR) repeat protein
MEKARAFDPKNPRFRSLGVSYFRVGDYEKALNAFGIDKGSTYSLGWQGYIHFRQGNYKQANVYFDRIIAMEPEGFWARSSFLWNEIMQGNNKEGLSILNELVQSYSEDAEMWYYWATEFAVLGDKNGCIKWLQRAVDGGYFNYPSMLTDSFLDSIRDDKEFQKVLQKAKGKHLAFKKRFFDKI